MPNHPFYKFFFYFFVYYTQKNVKPNKNRMKIWRIIKIVRRIKKIENINNNINKYEIIERFNIKEIELEIRDETKAFEEIKNKIKKIRANNNEKKFQKEIDEQETERLKIKIETRKLKKVNKIEGYEIRIKSIKDTTKRETEELRIER